MNCYLTSLSKPGCTGCSACVNICSHQALTMCEDSEGFLYPKIEKEKCVDCGLCKRICPININVAFDENNKNAFIVTEAEELYYSQSATIGVCTMLAHKVIKSGGIVYGVKLDERTWKASHVGADSIESWEYLRNSKYLQSNTSKSFIEVKKRLNDGQLVMYVGTGCQIAGLRSYLRREYDNLLTVDLICHGTFSYKMMRKEVEYWEKIYKGKLSNFRFRNKKLTTGGVVDFDVTTSNKKRHYTHFAEYSPVYRLFIAHGDGISYNLRPSCYNCQFREKGRYGDITLGDPWGTKDLYPEINNYESVKNGIGLVIVNTSKGQEYLEQIRCCANFFKIKIEDAYMQSALIPHVEQVPEIRRTLYDKLDDEDLGYLVESLLHIDFFSLRRRYYFKSLYSNFKKSVKRAIKSMM